MPKVCILVLNYNGCKDTIACIKTLLKNKYHNFSIVVIDNASIDESVKTIERIYPNIKVIENKENLGFAGGNNIGIQYAFQEGADYVFLLNNDTVVDQDTIGNLVKAGESLPTAGILGSVTYYYHKPEELWFAGGWIKWLSGRTGHYSKILSRKPYDSEFISGCALLIKRQVIEEIGLLDEDFFLYFEDLDWCQRALNKGYKLKVVPSSKVWHKVSSSTGVGSKLWQYYSARNLLLFMGKHNKFPYRQLFFSLYPLRIILKSLIILFSKPSLMISYIKGNVDYWKGNMGYRDFSQIQK